MPLLHRVIEGIRARIMAGDNHPRAGKAGTKVGMPIADDLAFEAGQPDDHLQAQQPLQLTFTLTLAHLAIAVLVEHTAYGDDRRPVSVNLNPTTF